MRGPAATLLRECRRNAGLTQAGVARRARTAQSAVAAYETAARTPSLNTLERLLGACDYELDIVVRPRMRGGAVALAALSPAIAEDLDAGDEEAAIRRLFGFADDFRRSSRPGRIALIATEPPLTGAARFDAALAATAEFFATEGAIDVPVWVDRQARFVEPWWFIASRQALAAPTPANTPAAFARHGVFVQRDDFAGTEQPDPPARGGPPAGPTGD